MRTAEETVLLAALDHNLDDVEDRLALFTLSERRDLEFACQSILEILRTFKEQ